MINSFQTIIELELVSPLTRDDFGHLLRQAANMQLDHRGIPDFDHIQLDEKFKAEIMAFNNGETLAEVEVETATPIPPIKESVTIKFVAGGPNRIVVRKSQPV